MDKNNKPEDTENTETPEDPVDQILSELDKVLDHASDLGVSFIEMLGCLALAKSIVIKQAHQSAKEQVIKEDVDATVEDTDGLRKLLEDDDDED